MEKTARSNDAMNKLFRLILAACFLLSYFSSALATFEKGLAHYDKGQFKSAFFIFKNLAEVGDNSSQFNLGVMYHRGEHVKRNHVMAYSWMRLAGEGGNDRYNDTANKVLASLSEKAATAAEREFTMLSSKYGQDALASALSPRPLNDDDCSQPPQRISSPSPVYPEKAIQRSAFGFVDLNYDISPEGYAREVSVRQTTEKLFVKAAVNALQRAKWEPIEISSAGDSVLINDLEIRYTFMIEGAQRQLITRLERESAPLLELAKGNDRDAQYRYAKQLEAIKAFALSTVKPEYRDLNKWYVKAAFNGHSLAQYEIGRNIIVGRGCEANLKIGRKWLKAAAVSGHPFAQEEIAMSALSEGLSNRDQAIYWLRRSASNDYYKAKVKLAWMLVSGGEHSEHAIGEVQNLLEDTPVAYQDEVRILETKAAVLAAAGNFKKAISHQKKALRKAKQLGWKIPVMNDRLQNYKESKTWMGPYYAQE